MELMNPTGMHFVRHAVKLMMMIISTLKKVEIEAAAEAWGGSDSEADEASEETDVAEEDSEEAPSELDGESEVEAATEDASEEIPSEEAESEASETNLSDL